MAGIEGFDIDAETGNDFLISDGTIDGVSVAAGTLVGTVVDDGTYLVCYNGSAFELVVASAQVATDIVLGTGVVATDVAASATLAGRGGDIAASADDSITL